MTSFPLHWLHDESACFSVGGAGPRGYIIDAWQQPFANAKETEIH